MADDPAQHEYGDGDEDDEEQYPGDDYTDALVSPPFRLEIEERDTSAVKGMI